MIKDNLDIMALETTYDVRLHLEKFPAYVVERLIDTGLHGRTRESVVEEIVLSWMREHRSELEIFGITLEDAKNKGYFDSLKD